MIDSSVVVIVVSYRNNRELIGFLTALHNNTPEQLACVVAVANGLDSCEVAELQEGTRVLLPGKLVLIASAQNSGYFGGAAHGRTRLLSARTNVPKWTIVTNDDIRFAPDFFARLTTQVANGPAVLAPDIIVPATGLHQNPYYLSKPPKRRIQQLLWLHRRREFMRLFLVAWRLRQCWRRRQMALPDLRRMPIYAPHGACMVFSEQYFAGGGSLDYPSFLYGEEFFVAESAKRIGLPVVFEPELVVKHYEHSSTGLLAPASMARYVHDSLSLVLREYYES